MGKLLDTVKRGDFERRGDFEHFGMGKLIGHFYDNFCFLGDITGDTMINHVGERLSFRCCQLLVTA